MVKEALVFPTSFAQQRLWFLDQLEPDNTAYSIPVPLRLSGSLNMIALGQSLNEIVRRHETLRTTISTVDGQPVQVISPASTFNIPVVDLQHLPKAEREAGAQELADEEARRPFDLAQGPLFRTTLLRLEEEEHILLLTMHHIISDGWSTGIFFRELAALYEAFSTGKPSPLPELPIQYADFAQWQREWLQGGVLEQQLSYWRQQLGGSPPALQLPTDYPRPAVQSYHGAGQSLVLSKDLSDSLKALGRQEGATLFMTLLAAFQVLLHRYSGQEDIVVGSPIAGRRRVETEGLIGFFVNTLVLRTDLSGDPTFRELLGRVREVTLGAYDHQDIPFEKLVEELQPERDLSRTPLFQAMFALQNAPSSAVRLQGLALRTFGIKSETAKFDLTLSMTETSRELRGQIECSTDLFDTSTISRILGHFRTLLEGIVANPQQCISTLPLLTDTERYRLIVDWNNTEAEYPEGSCVHQLFEAQAKRTPDAVAVVFENHQLTYRELNHRANQLAHYLQTLGVGPEVRVGICMERTAQMVIGLLGILKAGAAYVPLDPELPGERIAFILENAQVPVILTQQNLVENLPVHRGLLVCINSDWQAIAIQGEDNSVSGVTPQNLAYLVYTSGSTDKPKGVQISHRSLINLLSSMRQRPGIADEDILLAITTLSFDISALEIFLPLIAGARLVVASREVVLDGVQLSELISSSGATIMQATPATWRMLIEAEWQGGSQLKMLCGGEALPRELANQLLMRGSSLWNAYGPTETTIWSVVSEVESGEGEVSIGRPIANTQTYILDSNLQLVPVGVQGELHLGGDGLARGYLSLPELTAEKFIPNPFSDKPGARLYKTGDLAKYLPDGNIQFLGRTDYQVKIRGFRIELGEIESVLVQHPNVNEAVVLARETEPGDKRLVAYVVSNSDRGFTTDRLRSFLKERLPQYMIPSAFVTLESMPLTPNGKVDRHRLPAPDNAIPKPEFRSSPPMTPVESLMAEIWQDVLGVDQVGVYDNFFDLGGHSFMSMRVIARLEEATGVRIKPREMILQSLGQLASVLEQKMQIPQHPLSMGLIQTLVKAVKSMVSRRKYVLPRVLRNGRMRVRSVKPNLTMYLD